MERFSIILAFMFSFLTAILVLPRLSNIAAKIGLMDHPQERKVHTVPKPLVGGLGMLIAFFITCIFFVPVSELRGFYAGMCLLAVIGFLDDFREIDHRWKFLAQIFAAIVMMHFSNAILHSLGDLLSFGTVDLHIFAIPVTIIGTVGVINALNMIDGLDGLAGGISFIALASFALMFYVEQRIEMVLLCIALIGAVAGFIRYNWHPARLFMGDTGSMALGFVLAFLSISLTQYPKYHEPVVSPVFPLLVLGVPIVDTVVVMTKRMIDHKSPFFADKEHLHHHLIRLGLSKEGAVKTILLLSSLLVVYAIAGSLLQFSDYHLFMGFFIYFIVHLTFIFYFVRAVQKKRIHVEGRERVIEAHLTHEVH